MVVNSQIERCQIYDDREAIDLNEIEIGLSENINQGIDKSITYTILEVVELDYTVLFKLRDPRGNNAKTWTGDWGNNSKKWTDKLKTKVRWDETQKDGEFWMNFKDLKQNFTTVHCSYDVKDLNEVLKQRELARKEKQKALAMKGLLKEPTYMDGETILECTGENPTQVFNFKNPAAGDYIFKLCQKEDLNPTYSPSRMFLV